MKGEVGKVIGIEKEGIIVGCGEEALLLTSLQMEGKRAVSGEEFVRGYRVEEGEVLG
jgi:methionyl-tRNA formyltransferase